MLTLEIIVEHTEYLKKEVTRLKRQIPSYARSKGIAYDFSYQLKSIKDKPNMLSGISFVKKGKKEKECELCANPIEVGESCFNVKMQGYRAVKGGGRGGVRVRYIYVCTTCVVDSINQQINELNNLLKEMEEYGEA